MTADIDHDVPLTDASEVYDISPSVETSFEMSSKNFHSRVEAEEASVGVVDISGGTIALATSNKIDSTYAMAYAQLDSEDARAIANALLRAADYAEQQRGSSNDD